MVQMADALLSTIAQIIAILAKEESASADKAS